jgi:hypothetical protein
VNAGYIVSTLENRYTTDFQNSGCAAVGKARALTMKSDARPQSGLCGTDVPHKLKRSVHFFLTASIIKKHGSLSAAVRSLLAQA